MNIPMTEMMKSVPGALGIRLEEELPYKKMQELGEIELRHYEPFTLARRDCSREFSEAQDENFKALAEFIFGANVQKQKTAMTTPVFIDRTSSGWEMSFYLPDEVSSLTPVVTEIRIETMPAKQVAVYQYSGNNDLEAMETAKSALLSELQNHGLEPDSEVWWAQYDQPFAVPVLKRSEALVRIKSQN